VALRDDTPRPPAKSVQTTGRAFLAGCPGRIAEIFTYWDGLRQGRAMPRRAGFQPEAVPRHLSGILLIDVEGVDGEGMGIYRYRVVGTDEVRLRGHDPTGKLVQDGVFWSSLEDALATYERIRKERTHLYEIAEFVSPEGRWRAEYGILLPFSEDGETVSQILVYSLARSSQDG